MKEWYANYLVENKNLCRDGDRVYLADEVDVELKKKDEEIKRLRNDIELQALVSEREGMIAENKQREHRDESIAYGIDHFRENADRIRALKNAE